MKRLLTPLALVLILCFAMVGCAPKEGRMISSIPWPDEEETKYTFQDQAGNTMGNGILTITKEGESYILNQDWTIGQVRQISYIKVADVDLKPISGKQSLVSPGGKIEINTTYVGNKLKVELETPEGHNTTELEVPTDAYDNDEILFLFRALPFEEGYQFTYTNTVAATAQMPKVTVNITGTEQVEVPAGLFQCWKLELEAAGLKQYVWYSVDSPHYLVKYDDKQYIILLQEIPE
jgi:hypothetical protein